MPGREPAAVTDAADALVPASPDEIAEALAYALRHDATGKSSRTAAGWNFATGIAAQHLAAHLQRSGYVLMKRRPGDPHSAG